MGLPSRGAGRAGPEAMLDEGLEVLAGLWSGEPFGHHGEHYRIAGDPPEQDWRAVY
jgi:alkanesulfonate monooxygenase SsuD/methylene tetrahydromethanopterin reductase-like flavin-dependent oxidoreductase (luciferase family)